MLPGLLGPAAFRLGVADGDARLFELRGEDELAEPLELLFGQSALLAQLHQLFGSRLQLAGHVPPRLLDLRQVLDIAIPAALLLLRLLELPLETALFHRPLALLHGLLPQLRAGHLRGRDGVLLLDPCHFPEPALPRCFQRSPSGRK